MVAKRKPNAAFMKPVQPNEKLAVVVGAKPLPRTELTKKLWAYIKQNKLQDKKVRTQINADAALQAVFGGKKQVSMFEMTKLVSKNVKYVGCARRPRGDPHAMGIAFFYGHTATRRTGPVRRHPYGVLAMPQPAGKDLPGKSVARPSTRTLDKPRSAG